MQEASLGFVPGMLRESSIPVTPSGYRLGETRFASTILSRAFPKQFRDLYAMLSEFRIEAAEAFSTDESVPSISDRFRSMLSARGWQTAKIKVEPTGKSHSGVSTNDLEIEVFGVASDARGNGGIALRLEWNDDAASLDLCLSDFAVLHRMGHLGVGVIVTCGPTLHKYMVQLLEKNAKGESPNTGQLGTHWDALVSRINAGGGEGCPIYLIGIEPKRIDGFTPTTDTLKES